MANSPQRLCAVLQSGRLALAIDFESGVSRSRAGCGKACPRFCGAIGVCLPWPDSRACCRKSSRSKRGCVGVWTICAVVAGALGAGRSERSDVRDGELVMDSERRAAGKVLGATASGVSGSRSTVSGNCRSTSPNTTSGKGRKFSPTSKIACRASDPARASSTRRRVVATAFWLATIAVLQAQSRGTRNSV